MMRSNLSKLTFTLALAAVFAFGLALVTSEPASAAVACPTIACSSSATMTANPCDHAVTHEGGGAPCIYRCYIGTDRVGPFWASCYGNCLPVPL